VHGTLPEQNVGLVSDGFRFAENADCERIAGGLNSKNVNAVALGREANLFLWGFCAAPDAMSDEARKVFVNTVVYMRRFAGAQPIAPKATSGREWALNYCRFAKSKKDIARNYDAELADLWAELEAKDQGEFARRIAAALPYLDRDPIVVLEGTGDQTRKSERWVFRIDRDAEAYGIPNHDPRILERAVADLEAGREPARARRVLENYTDQKHGDDAGAWRAWLREHQRRLFFSDMGGYRFYVRP
jgi:hypothetical protein